jgi:hypothetical protein
MKFKQVKRQRQCSRVDQGERHEGSKKDVQKVEQVISQMGDCECLCGVVRVFGDVMLQIQRDIKQGGHENGQSEAKDTRKARLY